MSARNQNEFLETVKNELGVSELWSWSRINTFMQSPYEYFLKYVKEVKGDRTDSAYAPLGGICHDILEKYYTKQISFEEMASRFEDGFFSNIEIVNLKFNRTDDERNTSAKNTYYEDLKLFFKNHVPLTDQFIPDSIINEFFAYSKIGDVGFQGYLDVWTMDADGNSVIIDWKTSSKYAGKQREEKCGQLMIYAMFLHEVYKAPWDKIKICWDFLKYTTVTFEQMNGKEKTRDIERSKLGEGLAANVTLWMKKLGYSPVEISEAIELFEQTNDINSLPEDVRAKYKFADCILYAPLTEELRDEWNERIKKVVADIRYRMKVYEETGSEKIFYDTQDEVKSNSYYFANLCEYSPSLHLPYKEYVERYERQNEGVFDNVGTDTKEPEREPESVNITSGTDLSWLDEIEV